MKIMKISISLLLLGVGFGVNAQTQMAQPSPQYTRTYTLADINTIAKPFIKANLKESAYCSFVDTSGAPNYVKKIFLVDTNGNVSTNQYAYMMTESSSSNNLKPSVTVVAGTVPKVTMNVTQNYTPLTTTQSGNAQVFTYPYDGKTKEVLATTAGFFYRLNGSVNYMKGC